MKKYVLFAFSMLLILVVSACNFGANEPVSLSLELPDKVEYITGESFASNGLKVTATLKSGELKTLSDDEYNLTGTNLSRLGSHTIRVSYKSVDAEFTVYVKENPSKVLLASISDYPTSVFYTTVPTSENLKLEGLSINLVQVNGETKNANLSDFTATIVNTQMTDGSYKVYVVNMSHKTLEGIATGFLIYIQA